MKTITIKRKKDDTFLVVRGRKGQELNGHEYQEIQNGSVRGILRMDIEKYSPYYVLRADLNGLIPLNEFLGLMPLTRKYFAKLLRCILQILSSAEESHFNKSLFLYDLQYIMVEPAGWQFFFTYVPLQPFENTGTLKALLSDILQYASFEAAEDTSYVQDYFQIINNGPMVSLFVLEEYIRFLEAGIAKKKVPAGSEFFPSRVSFIELSSGQRVLITKLPFYIGSLPETSDMTPDTPGISRKHAELREESGQYVLVDNSSLNGTYVNGKRLIPGCPEIVHSGDLIGFAGSTYCFNID